MGTVFQIIEIAASPNSPFESLEALVDTGATYTWDYSQTNPTEAGNNPPGAPIIHLGLWS